MKLFTIQDNVSPYSIVTALALKQVVLSICIPDRCLSYVSENAEIHLKSFCFCITDFTSALEFGFCTENAIFFISFKFKGHQGRQALK